MKLLFENWRKYLIEADDPDSDADDKEELLDIANDLEKPDSQKLFDIFWGSGVQALELADMTGNPDNIGNAFRATIDDVQEYIKDIDGIVLGDLLRLGTRRRSLVVSGDDVSRDLEAKAEKIIAAVDSRFGLLLASSRYPENEKSFKKWSEDLIETGDYIWYHGAFGGTPQRGKPSNIASEERVITLYNWLREWSGVGV